MPDYHWNLHVHTNRSICGQPEMTLPAVLWHAREIGFEAIAITDHVNEGIPQDFACLAANRREIDAADAGLLVLVGAEAAMFSAERITMRPGDTPDLDFIMIAANHACLDWPVSRDPRDVAAHCLAATELAIGTGYCDVIPHPLLCKLMPAPMADLAAAYEWAGVRRMLGQAAAAGTALELNPRLVRMFPAFFRQMIELGQAAGVRFTVGTDAHQLATLGYDPEIHATLDELLALGLRPESLVAPAELAGRRRG